MNLCKLNVLKSLLVLQISSFIDAFMCLGFFLQSDSFQLKDKNCVFLAWRRKLMSTINLINFTYYPIQWPQRNFFVFDLPEKHKLVTNALTIRFYSMLLVKKQEIPRRHPHNIFVSRLYI